MPRTRHTGTPLRPPGRAQGLGTLLSPPRTRSNSGIPQQGWGGGRGAISVLGRGQISQGAFEPPQPLACTCEAREGRTMLAAPQTPFCKKFCLSRPQLPHCQRGSALLLALLLALLPVGLSLPGGCACPVQGPPLHLGAVLLGDAGGSAEERKPQAPCATPGPRPRSRARLEGTERSQRGGGSGSWGTVGSGDGIWGRVWKRGASRC